MRRIVGIIFIVLAMISSINVIRQLASGEPERRRGNEAYERGRLVAKFAPLFLFGLGFLMLRRPGTGWPAPKPPQVAPPRSGASLSPNHSRHGAGETFATNPGALRVNFARWLAAHPVMPTLVIILTLAGAGMLAVKYQVALILLLSAGIVTWQTYQEVKHKYSRGDVCAAEILSASAGLVAIYTDLVANSEVSHPVIKILKQPLHRMNPPAADGMRVAAVALYGGDIRNAAWNDFDPEVIHCVIADPAEIERVMQSITEDQWQALGNGLSQIPVAQPGLYPLWLESAGTTLTRSATPWLKRAWVRLSLGLLGICSAIVIATLATGWWNSRGPNRRSAQPGFPQPNLPSPPAPRTFPATGSNHASAYRVGQIIEANWAGGWIPGTIVESLGRDMSYRVQLEDRRFPHPLVLPSNLLRGR